MKTLTRPVWVDINLNHLAHNISEVKRVVKSGALISAVIKADGYGHGAVQIGQTLLNHGADRFAVATLSEAVQLKMAFPQVPVMVLGYTPDELIERAIELDIIQTVFSYDQALKFNQSAKAVQKKLTVHIKINTGMNRIGMPVSDTTVDDIYQMSKLDGLSIEGIFTHFSSADEVDKTFTHLQVERFMQIVHGLEAKGVHIPIKHVANSAAIIDCPEYHFDMVRAGIMLYGLYPSDDVDKQAATLKEVMSLKAQVAQVKTIQPGDGVSYGLKFKADKETQIATMPIGYADGFTRGLSFKAKGIIKGEIKPVVGRICMDQCMLEVDGLEVKVGDVVTLFGEAEGQFISIDDVAKQLDTINYEWVCMMGKRIPRRYVLNGECIDVVDFILR